ncbi:MAG: ATP-binding protein [Solirubrobacteraceae bacterium]
MSERFRLGALGLRGRIVGVVLATTVATLSVAALALLGSLEDSLRNAALTSFQQDVNAAKRDQLTAFRRIHFQYITELTVSGSAHTAERALFHAEQALQFQIGATSVALIWSIDASGHGVQIIPPPAPEGSAVDNQRGVPAASRTDQTVYSFVTIGGTQYVRAVIPVGGSSDAVLIVRKAINEIPAAVDAVQASFLLAASAGLVLTLLLAIPLSATLVRRLRVLRESALRLAADGTAAELPDDRWRDEVGDLTRTFALMQRRLRHQEEARRAFVATASHELRTPLASLDLMLELLADDLRAGEVDLDDAQTLLERARAQSKRLGRLAADLLDLSRIDADVQLRSEPVELGELSRAVIAEFELGTQERGVGCGLSEVDGAAWALGDPGAVARILRILLDNAFRVAPRGSEVLVSLRAQPAPSLSVIDRGPGVLEQERELIFERFKRGHDTGGQAGFGLGLAIGRELAERMGGKLELTRSRGPGAAFTLTLAPAQAPAAKRASSALRA